MKVELEPPVYEEGYMVALYNVCGFYCEIFVFTFLFLLRPSGRELKTLMRTERNLCVYGLRILRPVKP